MVNLQVVVHLVRLVVGLCTMDGLVVVLHLVHLVVVLCIEDGLEVVLFLVVGLLVLLDDLLVVLLGRLDRLDLLAHLVLSAKYFLLVALLVLLVLFLLLTFFPTYLSMLLVSTLPRALHLQWCLMKYLDLSGVPSTSSSS